MEKNNLLTICCRAHQKERGIAYRATLYVFFLQYIVLASSLRLPLSTAGFNLGHHHHADQQHVEEVSLTDAVVWNSVLTSDQHARALAHMVRS